MTINKFLTIRFCLLSIASALCLSACSQSEPELAQQGVATSDEWRPGLTYTADVDALVDDSPIEPISSDEARGLYDAASKSETHEGLPFMLNNKEYAAGSETHTHILPIVDFDRSDSRQHVLKSVLVFYDKTNNEKVLANANWSVRFLKNKTAGKPDTTKLTLTEVTLPAGKTLDKAHTWYMMSFLGGVEISGNTVSVKLNRILKNDKKLGEYYPDMYLNKVSTGQRVPMLVPFATSWRQVQVDGTKITPTVASGQKRTDHLIFKPQAAFIELSVANYISQPMKISPKITMESNCLTTEGSYDFSSLSAANFNGLTLATEPSTYWKPSGTRKTGVSDEWVRYNGLHFVSSFNLNDFPAQIAGRTGNSPVMVAGRYIIAVMPFNTKNPSVSPKPTIEQLPNNMEQTLFYCEPKMMKATGSAPTNSLSSYTRDPKVLTPSFGSRYLLGSTGDAPKKGRAYSMSLRLVRPMLPIERLYVHKGTELGFETTRDDAMNIPDSHMDKALKDKYRLPYWTEISSFLTVNYSTFKDLSSRAGGTSSWGTGYDKIATVVPNAKRVLLEPKQHGMYDMANFYSWRTDSGQDVIYGIMYIDPNTATQNYIDKEGGYNRPATPNGYERTNMYKVAVRISFPSNKKMTLDTYYIGSNLDINNQFFHLMHPSFWATVDQKAIITRTLPFNTADNTPLWYWGEGLEQRFENKNPNRMPILRSGAQYQGSENDMNSTAGNAQTVYWLKDRSW
mgnify:CR=1 FL=1